MAPDCLDQDSVSTALSELSVREPDPQRAERTRARCRAALRRRRAILPAAATDGPGAFWRRALEPALAACVGVVYLSEVVRRALHLYGF